MDRCEVLIVGGGPAGSACAWKLSRSGLKVCLLDKAIFPRDKVCAGWITPPVLQTLDIDPAQYCQGRVLQPINGFRIARLGDKALEVHYQRPISYGIRRCEFDHYLLQRSGAEIQVGMPLRSLEAAEDGWMVNEALRARLVVGAGGHFCPVARRLNPRPANREPAVVAQEIEFELDEAQCRACAVRAEVPELYLCEDLNGYGWCFRKGNFLNVGLGREGERNLPLQLRKFCDFLVGTGRTPKLPAQFHGHAYVLYQHASRQMLDERVLLIGDSAGLAYALSGEGIRPAVESGILAAETILQAQGEYSRQNLEVYPNLLAQRFGRAPAGGLLRQLLQRIARRAMPRLLRTEWFLRHVLLDRWFLHAGQTAL